MTERLFETRAVAREDDARFQARVLRADRRGTSPAVVLDRTLFYPTGGGQPCDQGVLAGRRVTEVLEEGETIVHVLEEGDAPAVGADVDGKIDLERRRDHKEQHSGQHLLSGVLLKRFKIHTVSFHLGQDVSTIDVQQDDLGPLVARVEAEANAQIRADLPVTARVFRGAEAQEEAKRLRKTPEPEALASPRGLRIIAIGDEGAVDRDACCGTHVERTGELGSILLLATERGKKGLVRVTFVVGGRAVRAARERLRVLDQTSVVLSTGFADLPARVEKLLDEAKTRRKELGQSRERIAELEAEGHARAAAARPQGGALVTRLFETGDPGEARAFASAVTRARGDAIALVVHRGEKATALVGRGDAAPSSIDASAVLKAALATFGGKGGGSAGFAQGAIPDASKAKELLAALEKALG